MAAKKILIHPNNILRSKSEPVKHFDDELTELAHQMVDTIESYSSEYEAGVALAAPQIGIPKRVIVAKDDNEYIALVNPVITRFSKEKIEDLEGCMSVPKKYGMVTRPKNIRLKAKTLAGEEIKISAEGMMARILQHEIDHLNGMLFIDYIEDKKELLILDKNGKLIKEGKAQNEV